MIRILILVCLIVCEIFAQSSTTLRRRPPFYGSAAVGGCDVGPDNFTGSNGTQLTTYSSNWTLINGDFDIQSNEIAPDASGTELAAYWNDCTFADNQYAQLTISNQDGNSGAIGVIVRGQTSANSYYGWYDDDVGGAAGISYIFKVITGSWTQLGATEVNLTPAEVMKLEISGTTLQMYIDESDNGTRTDSALSSGQAGLAGYDDNATQRGDNWSGGDL